MDDEAAAYKALLMEALTALEACFNEFEGYDTFFHCEGWTKAANAQEKAKDMGLWWDGRKM